MRRRAARRSRSRATPARSCARPTRPAPTPWSSPRRRSTSTTRRPSGPAPGSVFHLPVVRGVETADGGRLVRGRGMRILAMDADGERTFTRSTCTGPVAFVFGNEAWGLPEDVPRWPTATVRIPIAGRAESLNLAAAATRVPVRMGPPAARGPRAVLETIIAAAAHDIRSPLTAMKGFGHALATRWDQMTDEQRELMFAGIVYDTDRLNSIVRQLVDAARLAAGSPRAVSRSARRRRPGRQVRDALAPDPSTRGSRGTAVRSRSSLDPDRLRLVARGVRRVARLVDRRRAGPGPRRGPRRALRTRGGRERPARRARRRNACSSRASRAPARAARSGCTSRGGSPRRRAAPRRPPSATACCGSGSRSRSRPPSAAERPAALRLTCGDAPVARRARC